MKFINHKNLFITSVFAVAFGLTTWSCTQSGEQNETSDPKSPIIGSWKLLSGTIIQGKDTTVTDYTVNQEFIKIINDTHFAFLRHDLGQDTTAVFAAGGGTYELQGNKYIEHLDYYNDREWENHKFEFDFKISGDTLTTTGIEKIASLNIDHFNIERYIRIK